MAGEAVNRCLSAVFCTVSHNGGVDVPVFAQLHVCSMDSRTLRCGRLAPRTASGPRFERSKALRGSPVSRFRLLGVAAMPAYVVRCPIDFPPTTSSPFTYGGEAPVKQPKNSSSAMRRRQCVVVQPRDFEFHVMQLVKIKKRQIEFAWGPTPDRTLTTAWRLSSWSKPEARWPRLGVFRPAQLSRAVAADDERPTPCCKRPQLNRGRKPFTRSTECSLPLEERSSRGREQMLTVDFRQRP